MRLITIQDKKVFDTLISGKIYKADFEYIFDNIEADDGWKMKSYQVLMKHNGRNQPPIFCCVVDRVSDFNGTKVTKNNMILELEIPDGLVSMHLFTKWRDILFFNCTNTWSDDKYKRIAPYLSGEDSFKPHLAVQAIIYHIKPDYLIGAYRLPKDFINTFIGGEPLRDYMYNKYPIYRRLK